MFFWFSSSEAFCCELTATKHARRADGQEAGGQKVLALVCFTPAVLENPTDCPSQKIPSKRLLGWICVGEAKVDAAELSL